MAVGDQFGSVVGDLFGGSFTIVIWIILGFLLVVIAGLAVWYIFYYRKKFDITVKIISKRSGENKVYFDSAAIIFDRKKSTDYLKLWKSKVEIELPKFNIMHHTNKGDYIEILRESERGFRFLTPPEVDKKYLVRHNGKLYPFAQLKQFQIENDLSWIIERQKTNKRIINPESIFMKLLDNAPHIISLAFSFFMLWILFRFAPQLLNSLRELVKELRPVETVQTIGSFVFTTLGIKCRKKILSQGI